MFGHVPFKFTPTGAGKTLTFWIPLLFNGNGISIIITALNGLGDQNIAELQRLAIPAVNVTGQNATDKLFKEIEERQYRVVIISPELITQDRRVKTILWQSKKFVSHIFNITIDEGHCVSEWGKEFRPEYSQLGRLRWILPPQIPFHIVSATMPSRILKDVISTLNMRRENISKVRLSNDCPNIHLVVVELLHSAKSMYDINRVLRIHPSPLQAGSGLQHVKFMIFCNSCRDTQRMALFLREQLPPHLRDKIIWFHSGMTQEFRSEMIEKLRKGEIWGICCTDAAGMGLDIQDVEVIIQWGYVKSLCTLMQRLGRGARSPNLEATGIYFVDKNYNKKRGKGGMKPGSKRKSATQGGASKKARSSGAASGEVRGPVGRQEEADESESSESGSEEEETEENVEGASSSVEEEYETAVMDVFINAHKHSVCRRRVANEYFGNSSTCMLLLPDWIL
ncbi:hypothetical protein PAXINDRAFT_164396 [Paxillus involutus ATCC 200175]|uniref:DNA 3'-5' helicase n=1 Tax=Paxillus involutus ATCC 200175 TaxID=664439 RepID=A0A0C9TE86_PAXIN|nr:hypothetical protein PAXINDRAFT_164396 [Paxillus involutus ATCC 200175]